MVKSGLNVLHKLHNIKILFICRELPGKSGIRLFCGASVRTHNVLLRFLSTTQQPANPVTSRLLNRYLELLTGDNDGVGSQGDSYTTLVKYVCRSHRPAVHRNADLVRFVCYGKC